jgi:hypothetical protein
VYDTTNGRVLVWRAVAVDPAFTLGSLRPLRATEGEFLVF